MIFKDFKKENETKLVKAWNSGASDNYANYDSFCFREWRKSEGSEVEHEIMGWNHDC